MTAENAGQKQRGKPFQPGQSGNPKGKPLGTRHKATQAALALAEGQLTGIVQALVDAALAGDVQAARVIVDKLIPSCRERSLDVRLPAVADVSSLPKLTAAILHAVTTGDLTPGEAEKVASLAVSHGRVLEVAELEARIAALEASNE